VQLADQSFDFPKRCGSDFLNKWRNLHVSFGLAIGGGQVGFNYQFGYGLIGLEWDFDWAANNNNTGNGVLIPGVVIWPKMRAI